MAMIRGDEILKRLPDRPWRRAVEVGVQDGKLSRYLLERHGSVHLFMVDNWAPRERQPEAYRATRDGSALLTLEQCAERFARAKRVRDSYDDRVTILACDSENAASIIARRGDTIDLVFIDGDHSYEGVKRDLDSWLPRVRVGGWIGGHDYDNPSTKYDFSGVRRAVDERFGDRVEVGGDFTWWVKV